MAYLDNCHKSENLDTFGYQWCTQYPWTFRLEYILRKAAPELLLRISACSMAQKQNCDFDTALQA